MGSAQCLVEVNILSKFEEQYIIYYQFISKYIIDRDSTMKIDGWINGQDKAFSYFCG